MRGNGNLRLYFRYLELLEVNISTAIAIQFAFGKLLCAWVMVYLKC